MALVETKDLVKRYTLGDEDIIALDRVDLQFELGEFVAIMGRSGSGKSTLLNMVGCLDRPTSGSVLLGGVEVTAARQHELPRLRREKVGFVFQHFNLVPTLTALENVMLPLRYARVPYAEARRKALEALDQVCMNHRSRHRPAQMSGGEQQRVAIARAVINRPAVLLADEPTGNMDTQTAATIMSLMHRLNDEMGQTLIVVTHDEMVAGHATRIVRFKDGHVESDTRPATSEG